MAEADREQAALRAGSAPGSTGGLLVVRDARVRWGREHVNVNVNVNNLLAISRLDFDNSGEPGPQAKGVNHLECGACWSSDARVRVGRMLRILY